MYHTLDRIWKEHMQHGPIDYQVAISMLQAISTTSAIPFARVPWNEPSMIQRMLDAGAYGIICPMVNNRRECEQFVGARKYAPLGYRSNGPYRAASYAGSSDYVKYANDVVVAMAMIETREAFDNLDEICATPGLDAIFVGPSDLSLSMYGYPRMDHSDAPMLGHIEELARRCKAHGKPVGLFCGTVEYARRAIGMGYQFVNVLSDSTVMAAASRANLSAIAR